MTLATSPCSRDVCTQLRLFRNSLGSRVDSTSRGTASRADATRGEAEIDAAFPVIVNADQHACG